MRRKRNWKSACNDQLEVILIIQPGDYRSYMFVKISTSEKGNADCFLLVFSGVGVDQKPSMISAMMFAIPASAYET